MNTASLQSYNTVKRNVFERCSLQLADVLCLYGRT